MTLIGNFSLPMQLVCVQAQLLSHIWLFETPWIEACQAPLSMEFSRQEYWIRMPFPTPGGLLDPGIELMSPESVSLIGRFFTTEASGKPPMQLHSMKITSIDLLRLKSTPQIQYSKLDLKDRNPESWITCPHGKSFPSCSR